MVVVRIVLDGNSDDVLLISCAKHQIQDKTSIMEADN